MTKTTFKVTHHIAALALLSAPGFLGGCGDAHTFSLNPGHIQPDPNSKAANLTGADLELSRSSTLCDGSSSKSLRTKVSDEMEFSSVDVSSLDARCAASPTPGVEIDLEGASLIFDFSSVEGAGRFPNAVFDGYVFDVMTAEDDLLLIAAAVDTTASNVEVVSVEVSNQPSRIEVNFEGASYDEDSFVKIALWFARMGAR